MKTFTRADFRNHIAAVQILWSKKQTPLNDMMPDSHNDEQRFILVENSKYVFAIQSD